MVSHDGFGNVTLSKSDENGNVSEEIMPGNWSLFLNETSPQRHWTLEYGPFNTNTAVEGVLDLGLMTADLEVEIGGKVFWDLDDVHVAEPRGEMQWGSAAGVEVVHRASLLSGRGIQQPGHLLDETLASRLVEPGRFEQDVRRVVRHPHLAVRARGPDTAPFAVVGLFRANWP